ncbi:similar to Saccharomyces cerevisiae YNL035C Putative protein of unknown function with similarity to proteins containing WD-40 domains [Maudiozyma barnettii]|uniref:WD repeat-containing protein n=1 Tax=Maudiozyma barnettii TaxID=61262 RepID=A0A8H2VCP2_9SACH|nr:hypothetical protein [Kazachstania barnettii]CAB4252803.1 similar to Saccharomyces cerevisiae YNL035C Putative protein of unknown function with similarity to proteins containing WD-40 domains [Kazachstania barnettii]CAD1780593.1 similar to Saccharomyces cerevisiae YNL035C Putative protein of unknown function with similarity to proteins containing WD-40 domains [Kazachstania barnettii]
MPGYQLIENANFGRNNWCMGLQPLYQHGLLTSLSNGEVHLLDWKTHTTMTKIKVGDVPINKLIVINSNYHSESLFATASLDSVKIFDIRDKSCIATIHNDKNSPFLSLDSREGRLACGTELSGVDAELFIYDIRDFSTPTRGLVDSHHDDITDIKFHPSDNNILLSGSTDGYTNIYDLTEEDEDDALHQVINYASIHSCGWISPRRIYTLSHMETFAISELNDKSEELKEPQPLDFGDIRDSWGCNYVVDIYPGYIATGKSQEGKGSLNIMPLVDETPQIGSSITINDAHGDDVIRDVFIPPQDSQIMYSCGEDGNVKCWKNTTGSLTIPEGFWDYSNKFDVFDTENDLSMDVNGSVVAIEEETPERHKKKSKKSKSKKSKHVPRYTPY